MAYFHGVRVSEIPTRIITPVQTTAGLPVVFGTAPVHLAEDPEAYVNKPVICYEHKEAVAALGYSAEWDKYTLCEAMYTEFYLYAVKPIIFVNVLNPKKHKKSVEATLDVASDGTVTVEDSVLLKTLSVASGSITYTASTPTMEVEEGSWDGDGDGDSGAVVSATATAGAGPAAGSGTPSAPAVDVDYTAAFDDDGRLIVTIIKDGLLDGQASLKLSYDCVDPSMVTEADIIGGVDSNGNVTGLEQANLLNSQGIMTALNFIGGWKSWGDYTGAYPGTTDVKDTFICARR
ncbi:MAG: hypothetical protein IJT01_11955, partial [Selenomonadaceae bacterium]|nr:hypothetical protein [Selenomonadaceae bacterium]